MTQYVQQFYDTILGAGAYQVDFVTSTPTLNSDETGSCVYTVSYQDLVNNPGVEQQTQTPAGVVTFASGSTPYAFPPPDGGGGGGDD